MANPRTASKERDNETREVEDRVTDYRPPSNLPDPTPQDGYEFRWVRTAMLGEKDNRNVSMRYREGWEPCLAEDHPELMIMSDADTTYGLRSGCKCGSKLYARKRSTDAPSGNRKKVYCIVWRWSQTLILAFALV